MYLKLALSFPAQLNPSSSLQVKPMNALRGGVSVS